MIYKENETVKGTMANIMVKEKAVKDWSILETYISTISSRFLANDDIHEDINASLRDMGLIGRSCLDFVHPKDKDRAIDSLTTGFRTGISTIELRIKHKEGNWMWFECKGQTFTNKEGALNTLIISRDISDRKSAEKRYKYIFENSPNAILLINFKGIVNI